MLLSTNRIAVLSDQFLGNLSNSNHVDSFASRAASNYSVSLIQHEAERAWRELICRRAGIFKVGLRSQDVGILRYRSLALSDLRALRFQNLGFSGFYDLGDLGDFKTFELEDFRPLDRTFGF